MRVASNGSMNQTAAELDLSIATVSQKIKDIEAVLGYPIFERTTKKTRLTPEGVQLLAAAKNPLDSFKSFVSDIHSADRMKKIHITCSISNSISRFFFRLCAEFKKAHPEVEFELIDNQYSLRDRLKPADVSIFANLSQNERSNTVLLGKEPTIFCAPASIADRYSGGLTLQDLSKEMVLLCSNWTCPSPFLFDSRSGKTYPLPESDRMYFISSETVLEAVTEKLGVAWALPYMMAEMYLAEGEIVRVLPDLEGPSVNYFMGVEAMITEPIVSCFIEYAASELRKRLAVFQTSSPSYALY